MVATSKNTSLKQIPAFLKSIDNGNGRRIADFGCGRNHAAIRQHVEARGWTYEGTDPNWHPVAFSRCAYDVATCCNVLNVLESDTDAIRLIMDVVTMAPVAVFQVYEGDRSGMSRHTKADCFQRNWTAARWQEFIADVAGDSCTVQRRGNVITVIR